jgi:hypothetical protein
MISTIVNSLRAFKGLYDLIFSDTKFYVDSRAELKNGVGYSIEQFKAGLNEPPVPRQPLIRKPYKIMLCVLLAIFILAVMFGQR